MNLCLPRRLRFQAAAGPDTSTQTASVATPEGRFVNPDGTVTSTGPAAPEQKTRLSNRPSVPKAKRGQVFFDDTPAPPDS